MDGKEIRDMRLKQLFTSNIIVFLTVFLFYGTVNVVALSSSHFFFIIGMLFALQGVIGLLRGDKTKSIIPIFEKVAVYEKKKMGSEWFKERKTNFTWYLVLGALMFMQSYWNRDLPKPSFLSDPLYFIFLLIIGLVVSNIMLLIRFRKIDHSTNELQLKGYTRKSNVIGIGIGIIFAMIMGAITIYYILL